MSDREAVEKAPLDDPDAFEARFPPAAFEPIARALNLVATRENVSAIRSCLIPYLEQSFSGKVVKKSAV